MPVEDGEVEEAIANLKHGAWAIREKDIEGNLFADDLVDAASLIQRLAAKNAELARERDSLMESLDHAQRSWQKDIDAKKDLQAQLTAARA